MLANRVQRFAAASLILTGVPAAFGQQTPPPTVPTPTELEGRRNDSSTDASRLPPAPPPAPRRIERSAADVLINIVSFSVNADAPAEVKQALPLLTGKFVGKDKTFADMSDAAAEVTRYMQAELGLYLGFAYVPEQDLVDGVIRLQVLEGRLDRIELTWPDGMAVDRDVVEGYLALLKPGDVLRVRDVERVVFLVNDLRGMAAEFEVEPGASPGTAKIIVKPRVVPLRVWRFEVDNANARTLGRERVSGSVYQYSPFGRGDSLSASLIAARGLSFALGNYTTPVGSDGFRLGLSASVMRYQVDKNDFPLGIEGNASTVSSFGLYPLVRSRNLNLFLLGSMDVKFYNDTSNSVETKKRVVNPTIGLTGDFRDACLGGGINSFDTQLAFGRVNFDVKPATDAPSDHFVKFNGRYVRLQNIVTGVLQGYVAGRIQKAWNNLDVTEQFRAGGPDGVRAFPAGEGSGDNGLLLTAELRALPPADWNAFAGGGEASVSLFADWARVQLRNRPTDLTVQNLVNYGGWGVALNWNGPDGWELRASLARPTVNQPRDKSDQPAVRAFVQLGKQF